jgi:AraC-like DNA-binding protein
MTEREDRNRAREDVLRALDRNRKRRHKAEYDLDGARQELGELLASGLSLPWPLKIAAMAREAGISRETAYKLLRRRDG